MKNWTLSTLEQIFSFIQHTLRSWDFSSTSWLLRFLLDNIRKFRRKILICVSSSFKVWSCQVAVVWVLPVILLHSHHLNNVRRKRRRRHETDTLTPALTLVTIILSVPGLVNFVAEIALFQPTLLMHRLATLCLNLASTCKIIFYLSCDKHLRSDLLCSNDRILVRS